MADFLIIKNEKLRRLLIDSAAVNSMPAVALQSLLERISLMPREAELEFIKALESVPVNKDLPVNNPSVKDLKMAVDKLKVIKKNLNSGILHRKEEIEDEDSAKIADNLIDEL